MCRTVLRVLAYIVGIIGGIIFVWTVIARIALGPTGTVVGTVNASSMLRFSEVCLVFSISLGIAAILETVGKKKT